MFIREKRALTATHTLKKNMRRTLRSRWSRRVRTAPWQALATINLRAPAIQSSTCTKAHKNHVESAVACARLQELRNYIGIEPRTCLFLLHRLARSDVLQLLTISVSNSDAVGFFGSPPSAAHPGLGAVTARTPAQKPTMMQKLYRVVKLSSYCLIAMHVMHDSVEPHEGPAGSELPTPGPKRPSQNMPRPE